MGKVTEDNVSEWSGYIEALYSGLAGLRGGKLSGGTASSLKSDFEKCKASGWADDVGVAFNANVDTCISAMDMMNTTVNGGAFNQMISGAANAQTYAKEVIRLKNLKSDYARYRSNLDTESENYSTRYNHYTELINNCDTHIKGNLEGCNGEIDKMPSYHFEGSGVTSDAGSSGTGGNTGGDTGGASDNSAKRAEVADKFDRDSIRDHMGQLFDMGVGCYVTVEYGGEVVYIKKVANDSYAICDYSGQPLSDVRFTHSQVTPSEATYVDGQATYPAVEEACIDYFANK